MTASSPTRTNRIWGRYALLLIPLIAGIVAGAYLDWMWWHPTSGIVVTIGAATLVVAGALAWRSPWTPLRSAAPWAMALGIGALLGQNVGPSRPPVTLTSGTMTIRLTEPADVADISGRADCQAAGADNFQISGGPNMRMQVGDQPLDQRDPIGVSLARGDMWQFGDARPDGWGVFVNVGDAGPFTDDQIPANIIMESTAGSELTGSGTAESGSVAFAGLVLNQQQSTGVDAPIELAGTIEWTCDGPVRGPEG